MSPEHTPTLAPLMFDDSSNTNFPKLIKKTVKFEWISEAKSTKL